MGLPTAQSPGAGLLGPAFLRQAGARVSQVGICFFGWNSNVVDKASCDRLKSSLIYYLSFYLQIKGQSPYFVNLSPSGVTSSLPRTGEIGLWVYRQRWAVQKEKAAPRRRDGFAK